MEHIREITAVKTVSLTDADIVTAVLNGNTRQYEEIMRRYNQRLYRIARGMGLPDDQCDDILQETHISAYKSLESYRHEAAFSTWLTRILINCCLMYKRKSSRIREVSLSREEISEPSHDESPQAVLLRKEMRKLVEDGIAKLPENLRVVYMMREVEGMNVKETAASLNLSESNIKVLLHRSKLQLRSYLDKQLGDNEIFTFGNERCDRIVKQVLIEIERPFYC